jgi:group I intron endonuclease
MKNVNQIASVVTYIGADLNVKLLLQENKGKSGIYRWTNNITGASYVGSAVDLARRLRQYYSLGFLKKELVKNNSIIYKALLKYGYSSFRLEILEYCNKDNLLVRASSASLRSAFFLNLIKKIEREQYYLDL